MWTRWLSATALCLLPSAAVAQMVPPVPFEASVGLGPLFDHSPSQSSPAIVGGLSWDYDKNWWGVLVVEGEIGAISEAQPCRGPAADTPDSCLDAAVLGGFRVRRVPHVVSGARPFVHVLFGEYWKGSGLDDPDHEFASSHFAMQLGGGMEIRWPGSFQGVRVSVDVRRVFAGDHDRNQVRLLCAYVIGPRRFVRPVEPAGTDAP
jgi:hypothetical protein